jgi:hypothetical protein
MDRQMYRASRANWGIYFSSTLKSADAPWALKKLAKLAGDGAAHAVFLKKQSRAHVGFTRRAELMPACRQQATPELVA